MSNPKTIYLHIGEAKTGSTSIRRNLEYFQSQTLLEKYDFTAIAVNDFLESSKKDNLNKDYNFPLFIEKIKELLNKCTTQNIIISAENFSIATKPLIDALQIAFEEFNVKLYMYLRRDDISRESHFSQSYKRFKSNGQSPNMFLIKRKVMLDMYANAFGKENIHLRIYNKKTLLDGNAVHDFLGWTGLNKLISHVNQSDSNPSLSPAHMRIAIAYVRTNTLPPSEKKQIRLLLKNELLNTQGKRFVDKNHQFGSLMRGNVFLEEGFVYTLYKIRRLEVNPAKNTHNYITLEERKKYLEECKEEHSAIAREYLGREDGVLFDDSMPKEEDRICLDNPTLEDLTSAYLPVFKNIEERIVMLESKKNYKPINDYSIANISNFPNLDDLIFTYLTASVHLTQRIEKLENTTVTEKEALEQQIMLQTYKEKEFERIDYVSSDFLKVLINLTQRVEALKHGKVMQKKTTAEDLLSTTTKNAYKVNSAWLKNQCANEKVKEAGIYKSVALFCEKHNQIEMAQYFMKIAQELRPNAPAIIQKCKEYEKILTKESK